MTAPRTASPRTILRACAQAVEQTLLPEISGQWARYSGDLVRASLEYAVTLLEENRSERHRGELGAAIEALRPAIERSGDSALSAALAESSPFEIASRILVAAQRSPSPLSDELRAELRPLLLRQLDEECAATLPLLIAFAKNMQAAE